MASKELVTKVWIEEGCIVCDACETAAPEVFEVQDETCLIRPEALDSEFTKARTEGIVDAAEECPVDVIKFETVTGEAPDEPAGKPTAVPAAAEAEPATAAAAKSPAAVKASAAPAEPAKAMPAKAPERPVVVSAAGEPDPAIQALLRAATQRGGMASISRASEDSPSAQKDWEKAPASTLPPDARQIKKLKAAKQSAKKDGVTRRGALAGSAVGIGWLTFGGTTALSGVAFQRFMMPNVLEEPEPQVRVGLVKVYAAMAPGEVNEDYKPQGIWMIREEERFSALNIICTHLGCIPNWLSNDQKFKCPCHGSGFRPNGINFEGPAPRPLERFKISVVDGLVVVDRSKKFQYEKGQWDHPESYIAV